MSDLDFTQEEMSSSVITADERRPSLVVPDEGVLAYVWLAGSVDNITSGHKKTSMMARRDWEILLAADPDTRFEITSSDFSGLTGAAIVRPGVEHALRTSGISIVRLVANLVHPQIGALMHRPGPGVEIISRGVFAPLNELLTTAALGHASLDAYRLHGQVLSLVLAGQPEQPRLDPRVRKALRKLTIDIDYPFDALASEAGTSLSRLSHLVSDQLGLSLRHFQAWLRMAQALRYIVFNPDMSFTDIAHALKFSDSSHLARAFRHCYGVSPTLFRDTRGAHVQVVTPPTDRTVLSQQ